MSTEADKNRRRVIGRTTCLACGLEIEVVNTYANSRASISLRDHTKFDGKRCKHAGLVIWAPETGWHRDPTSQAYGSAGIWWVGIEKDKEVPPDVG